MNHFAVGTVLRLHLTLLNAIQFLFLIRLYLFQNVIISSYIRLEETVIKSIGEKLDQLNWNYAITWASISLIVVNITRANKLFIKRNKLFITNHM